MSETLHTEHHDDIQKHVRQYLIVFASLAVLTVVTVAVGYLHLSILPAVIIGLFIATIKAGLVAAYFMHLISEKKVIYGILLLTAGCVVILFVLTGSTLADQAGGVFIPTP